MIRSWSDFAGLLIIVAVLAIGFQFATGCDFACAIRALLP
jgi:hypothetical protein